jgi:hypothetical protein
MKDKFKEIIDKYGVMQLLGSDGACACGEMYLFGIKIHTHCHRSNYADCDCLYAGVHLQPDPDIEITKKELKEIGKLFKDYIQEAYMCSCEIFFET